MFCLAGLDASPNAATPRTEKVRVSDAGVASELVAKGAKKLADYGSFQVLSIDPVSAAVFAGQKGVESVSHENTIALNARVLDTTRSDVQALRARVRPGNGKRLHLVHFVGPIKPEWWDELASTGVQVVTYVPHNAYLVYGPAAALQKLQGWAAQASHVQWEGSYLPNYKIHPGAQTVDARGKAITPQTELFAIQFVEDAEANGQSLQVVDGLRSGPILRHNHALGYLNIVVKVAPENLAQIAAQQDVVSIQPYFERRKFDERQDQIVAGNLAGASPSGPGYLGWLSSIGFTQAQFAASSFAVDISDSGVDNGTSSPGHFGLYPGGDTNLASRIIYGRLLGTPNMGSTIQGCDGHGTLNAHIIGGYNNESNGFPHTDSSGYHYGLGICPFVKIGSSVIFDPDSFTYPNFDDLQSQAYADGSRISANSWGANVGGIYDAESQAYDALVRDAQPAGSAFATNGNQEMVIVFASGNAGPSGQTVGAPGSAKNVITVGASENVRSLATAQGGNNAQGNDGCNVTDSGADNSNDIINFSSRGPCSDGRQKPDLVAPGTHITGGVAQTSPPPAPSTTGTAIDCFRASGVCSLPGGGSQNNPNDFFPQGQQFYTTSSGTSHSTPAVAGACALLRQLFLNRSLNPPSPALTKAWLVNSTRYLNGIGANDSLWSPNQGMGAANLGAAFDSVPRIVRDQLALDKFTATGQSRTFVGLVSDPSKPFRVTLAWTDAPGNTTGNAYNNDLDLVVTVGGKTYKGNVFSGPSSATGGSADFKNNLESVFLPSGVNGNFTVTVTAANINSDGVPNEDPPLDQDFALVIYNAVETAAPVISAGSATISAESCSPTNNAVDSGETVTMAFPLINIGSSNTVNVVATLLATNGVTSPSAPQTYGPLLAGGLTVTQSFSFTASADCGQIISPTFQIQDGAKDLGLVSFSVQLGLPTAVLNENFDSVAVPALPAGWTSSATGGQNPWTTSVSSSDTAPNSVFSPDAGSTGLNELDTPIMFIPSAGGKLIFRHTFDLESGYDGGVLEMRIGNGVFADVLTAGAIFVTGGYSSTISGAYGNPLGGRQAWTGNSGGFITTILTLPASAAGQNVQFRWRCGSDSSIGASGWYVDTVAISAPICCGQTFPPQSAFSATPTNGQAPLTVTFADFSTGTITNRFWNFGNGITTNTAATNFMFTYTTVGTNSVTLTTSGPAGANTLTESGVIVVTNAVPVIVSNAFSIVTENCTNASIDPGETVTMLFGLSNVGSGYASNLVATLASSTTVVSPSGPQTYGFMAPGDSLALPFTFTAIGDCGATNAAILQLNDGATNLGTLTFTFPLGSPNSYAEGFDGVTVPSLPGGWSSSATGGQTPWVTSSVTNATAPNSAFAPDPGFAGESILVSPTINIPLTANQLSFQHYYNMETGTGNVGYDGGVFEIKIGNGSFQDILDAGGSFASGGYNKIIATGYGNPLAGRQAWSGDSGQFGPVLVNLPVAALGQPVQFRWRCGSDSSVGVMGWYVDALVIGGLTCCSNGPTISAQPQNRTVLQGQSASFSVGASGTAPFTYFWRFSGTNLAGATTNPFVIGNAQVTNAGGYDVIVCNPVGSVTSSVATLTLIGPPVLLMPHLVMTGHMRFTLSGNTGLNYGVETTSNMVDWILIRTYTNLSGDTSFTETNTATAPFRAFRARILP
jgi:PKD repeat protein